MQKAVAILIVALAVAQANFLGEEMIQTPFGKMYKECVHSHPQGTYVEETAEGLRATNAEANYVKFIPYNEKCVKAAEKLGRWVDNVGYYFPSGRTLGSFTGTYTVPSDPATSNGQILYYFIGS